MKVSVIITVYNEFFYLYWCLRSLAKQTFKDFEIIIVNDGDNPKVLKVITNFINKYDGSVILVNEGHGGVGMARNRGVNVATGEYIKFLDCDDTLTKNALEVMYREAKLLKADCLVTKGYVSILGIKFKYDFNFGEKLGSAYMNPMVGNKLFKRELILDNLFIEDTKWEDLSNIPYILSLDSTKKIDYRLFNYRFHKNTTFKDFFNSDKSVLDIIKVLNYLKLRINKKDFKSIAIIHTLFRLESLFYSRNTNEELERALKDYLYSIDNYWKDYEIIKIYSNKDILFRIFMKYSNL